jgi:methanogenic corrinoid protein MtbC1
MWERRYGVVRPSRSAGGQRLYSDADVERLELLRRATQAGRSIGQLRAVSNDALAAMVGDDQRAEAPGRDARAEIEAGAEASALLERARGAVPRLDAPGLEAALRRALLGLGVAAALDHVFVPLLRDIGERWEHGEISPAHEHVASAVVRRVLDASLRDCEPAPAAPTFVVATPPGQVHELGALLAAVSAAAEGWRVVYLGSDLPLRDVARAALQSAAAAVGLSIVHLEPGSASGHGPAELLEALPAGCRLLLGGAAAPAWMGGRAAGGVEIVPDLGGLRSRLEALHRTPEARRAPRQRDASADG